MLASNTARRLGLSAPRWVATPAPAVQRSYAVLVNGRSSIDPMLGIAPPVAAEPMAEGDVESSGLAGSDAGSSSSVRRTGRPRTKHPSLPEQLREASQRQDPQEIVDLIFNRKAKEPGNETSNEGAASRRDRATEETASTLAGKSPLPNNHTVEVAIEGQGDEGPTPVDREHPHPVDALYGRNELDERILAAARALHHSRQQQTSPGRDASTLGLLHEQFSTHAERVLSISLPNENTPSTARRVPLTSALSGEQELQDHHEDGVLLIAYVTGLEGGRGQERITLCSGFAIEGGDRLAQGEGNGKGAIVVSCAHTLRGALPKEAPTQDTSIALAVTRGGHVIPIKTLLSSLPRSDLVLLQLGEEAIVVEKDTVIGTPLRSSAAPVRTLPVNPYPAAVGTEVCVSSFWGWEDDAGSTLPAFEFVDVGSAGQSTPSASTTSNGQLSPTVRTPRLVISPGALPPPIGREQDQVKRERDDAGRSRWGRARLVEYRNWDNLEATAGTYEELAHLDFKLLSQNLHNPPALQSQSRQRGGTAQFPPPGSSGGPIVDAATGAVVGVTRGTKMSQLEGKRGDGVPAERIYYMFALPGFEKKKKE